MVKHLTAGEMQAEYGDERKTLLEPPGRMAEASPCPLQQHLRLQINTKQGSSPRNWSTSTAKAKLMAALSPAGTTPLQLQLS